MVRKKEVPHDRTHRVILESDSFRALMHERTETGRSVQGQVNEIVRQHLKRKGLIPEAASAP